MAQARSRLRGGQRDGLPAEACEGRVSPDSTSRRRWLCRIAAAAAMAVLPALTGCLSAPLAPSEPVAFDTQAALAEVNAFRAANGAPPLRLEPRLADAAAAQSASMAGANRMSHTVAGRLTGRVERYGYAWRVTAENIGRDYATFDAALAGWEASPHHRDNLLNRDVSEIGLAAARGVGRATIYWTMILGAPKH
nr:CAP domain-containing protein [Aurantimonas sp. CSK15Z-1]